MDTSFSMYRVGAEALLPPRDISVSQWADENVVLTGSGSAERGQWHTRPYQREPMDVLSPSHPCKQVVLMSAAQMLKCLAINTPLPVPGGWTAIGDISVGDRVFDDAGNQCSVVGVSEVFTGRECYRITFEDGSELTSDADHRWVVFDRLVEHTIVTTKQMLAGGLKTCAGAFRYRIPCARPLATATVDLPLDPYFLGVWLGDGTASKPEVTSDLRDGVFAALGAAGLSPTVRSVDRRRPHVATITFAPVGGRPVVSHLREMQLLDNKHIPEAYLRASQEQRRSLLQGILDTDGTAGDSVVLGLSSAPLAHGVLELARSLGFKPTIRVRPSSLNGKRCKDVSLITFKAYREDAPFRLDRKLNRLRSERDKRSHPTEARRRSVASVDLVESVPVRCIAVDSPTHLYLAGAAMVPTHNTSVMVNFLGYIADVDPGPTLAVEPRSEDAKALSKDRVAPLFRHSPALRGKLAAVKSRDSNNTAMHKVFANGSGHITFTGAISPSGLAMRPIRYLLLDEVDRYPLSAGSEGDPVSLAMQRTGEFEHNKKVIMCSTPTVDGESRIQAAWNTSDQREYFVPCPKCNHFQILVFSDGTDGGLVWPEGEPEKAAYCCEKCRELIPHNQKSWMVERGEYRPQNPGSPIPGFRVSQLISPKRSWGTIAAEFLVAKGSTETLKAFLNTVLAELWTERGSAPDWEKVYLRREDYALGIVPAKGSLLVAGVDVQDDRLEVEIKAYGRGKESWSVDYRVIQVPDQSGQSLKTSSPEVWQELEALLAADWPCESGRTMPIMAMTIDTGFRPQMVYEFAARHPQPAHGPAGDRISAPRTVVPTKGTPDFLKLIARVSSTDAARKRQNVRIWHIGTHWAKQEFYDWLRIVLPDDGTYPAGYQHYAYKDQDFYRGLCSESRIIRSSGKVEWIPDKAIRNEPLDLAVLCRAAAAVCGIDRFSDEDWAALENNTPTDATRPSSTDGYWGGRDDRWGTRGGDGGDWFK